jgi:hypothetical protein
MYKQAFLPISRINKLDSSNVIAEHDNMKDI